MAALPQNVSAPLGTFVTHCLCSPSNFGKAGGRRRIAQALVKQPFSRVPPSCLPLSWVGASDGGSKGVIRGVGVVFLFSCLLFLAYFLCLFLLVLSFFLPSFLSLFLPSLFFSSSLVLLPCLASYVFCCLSSLLRFAFSLPSFSAFLLSPGFLRS